MHWIIASLIMFFSSVVLYLAVRWSNSFKTPIQLNNLAMFLVPVIFFALMHFSSNQVYVMPWRVLLIIVVQALLFSYAGNVLSLKAIQLAPNPGYSLIISKSYVVFTAIASVFLFQSPLTLKSIFAITLIIIFSALIIINRKQSSHISNSHWIYYSVGAFFCAGFSALSSKYLLNIGVPILVRLIYSMTIVTVLIMLEMSFKKIRIQSYKSTQWSALLLIGVAGATFSYFMQVAFDAAPNVGYVNAANAGSISLLTIMSALIFKDELTIKKIIGIIGVTGGLILLFI
jgi:uncharacterized membrane protein